MNWWNAEPGALMSDDEQYDEPQPAPLRIPCRRPDCRRMAVTFDQPSQTAVCRACQDVLQRLRELKHSAVA